MFPKIMKIICIIHVINSFSTFSKAVHISERNETNLILSMYSQLSELSSKISEFSQTNQLFRAELDRQRKEGVNKEADIQFLQSDARFLRADVQSLRTELENQRKDGFDKDSDIQILRAELERLKNDGINRDSNIGQIKAELQQQNKCEVDNQSLQADMQRLRELVDGLVNPHKCTKAKSNGFNEILLPNFSSQPFKVVCDVETRGGGWTILLRRLDGSVNFYRNWTEYKNGFGNLDGEFFLGLDKIHALTAERRQELLVILEDFEGDNRFETYDDFAIGDEDQQYVLHTLGKANGSAGDSLSYHRGKKFSTFDRDNDIWKEGNCAEKWSSAWWYGVCHHSNLAGNYNDNTSQRGVNWAHFRGHEYSLKKAVMMIRPRK